MALPFLPGNVFNRTVGQTKFHKSHHWDKTNSVPMLVGEAKPGIGGERLPFQKLPAPNSSIPRGQGTDLPAWVAFDKQVLSFDGYFQEAVHERREEQYRVRSCKVYFYLEDDSIQVIEPRLKNTGVPQGTIIRRHRIPRPAPDDSTFFTVEDFNVGRELIFYGRTFKLTSCDQFTENFLTKLGVKIVNPVTIPQDPYMNHRKALDESMQPLRPYQKVDTLKQFLDHDRHVLRFFGYWDDTENMFGDKRNLVLHYFLADDTMEIREMIPANSGRDAVPMFLKRAKVPKQVNPLWKPGELTDRTILNVFGSSQQGGRWIPDSLKTGAVTEDYYTDNDLTIGSQLNVYGRKVVLCDCDEFTREYYNVRYGITEMQPIKYMADRVQKPDRQVPPYNGFGGEEDSLCSCKSLIGKAPQRDFVKFMEKDRRGLDSNVLRFHARLDTTKPIDMGRRFIISYFLSDDTILVYEPAVRNSGIIGGKFMERCRMKKPDQERFSTKLSEYYMAPDLYVGTTVRFNRFDFILIDADEYAYKYIENNMGEFPVGDFGRIMHKLKCALPQDDCSPAMAQEVVSFQRFLELVQQKAPDVLTEHELRTLARYYQQRKDSSIPLADIVAVAQEQLRKQTYEGFTRIVEQCIHHDEQRTGMLPAENIRGVIHALKIPLPDDLLRSLLMRLTTEAGSVDYNEFVQHLNWRDCPVKPPSVPTALTFDWEGSKASYELGAVDYGQMIRDLCGGAQN